MFYCFYLKNARQIDKWYGNMSAKNKVSKIPNVSWWLVGNQAIAMSGQPIGNGSIMLYSVKEMVI
jgi:hypothetical protein